MTQALEFVHLGDFTVVSGSGPLANPALAAELSQEMQVIQLVYVSSAQPGIEIDPAAILATARRNNRMLGVTGLLYFDGARFLQAIEGGAEQVDRIFARIQEDRRHRALVMLSRRDIDAREFGEWEMAYRDAGDDANAFIERVRHLAGSASPEVRGIFEGLAEARRAA